MFLEILCNAHRVPIELTTSGGKRRILLDGRELDCDWIPLPEGRYSIIVNGRVFDLGVELNGQTCTVASRNGTYTVRLIDSRHLPSGRDADQGMAGLQRISAEMPGKVVRILVKVGDTVKLDQGLLVLEAMKMQNEIRAPKSGVVKEVGVIEGKAVNSGEFLISLE